MSVLAGKSHNLRIQDGNKFEYHELKVKGAGLEMPELELGVTIPRYISVQS